MTCPATPTNTHVYSTNGHEFRQRAWDEWQWLQYWTIKFTGELCNVVVAFKAARLFLPSKVNEIKPDASIIINSLKAFPFLDNSSILDGLKEELPSYLAKAEDVQVMENTEVLLWWKKQHQ